MVPACLRGSRSTLSEPAGVDVQTVERQPNVAQMLAQGDFEEKLRISAGRYRTEPRQEEPGVHEFVLEVESCGFLPRATRPGPWVLPLRHFPLRTALRRLYRARGADARDGKCVASKHTGKIGAELIKTLGRSRSFQLPKRTRALLGTRALPGLPRSYSSNFLNTATLFWPPKPKPLAMRGPDRRPGAAFGHVVEVALGVGVLELIVGGTHARRGCAIRRRRRDIAPAAPSRWPIIDLGELTGTRVGVLAERQLERAGLGRRRSAACSCRGRRRSRSRPGVSSASAIARSIARAALSPVGSGAVTW